MKFGRKALSLAIVGVMSACSGDDSGSIQYVYVNDTEQGGARDDLGATPGAGADITLIAVQPALYKLSHVSGPVAGGTVLQITGAGYQDGVKVAFGSGDATVLKVAPDQLVVRTPPGAAGPADVAISNPDGGAGLFAKAFTYYEPGPETAAPPDILESIPGTGPSTGGTVALLRGNNFQQGSTFFIGWTAIAAADMPNATTATIVTPPLPVGTVSLAVTNPDGQSAELIDGFRVFAPGSGQVEEVPSPQIDSIEPQAGSIEGGLLVRVKGANFRDGSKLLIGGKLAQTWSLLSDREGTFEAPPHEPGVVDIAITDGLGQSGVKKNAFLYFVNPPVIYSVDPPAGPKAGGTLVTIKGKHFVQGMTVLIDGKPCTGVTVGAGDGASSTGDFATCTIPPGDVTGPVMVEATNPGGLAGQLPGGYTYLNPTPAVLSVEPNEGALEGGFFAVVRGADFLPGSGVRFGDEDAKVLQVSPDTITVEVPPQAFAITVAITVHAPGWPEATLEDAFTYRAPGTPALLGVSPTTGSTAGGTAVAITGSELRPESQLYFGGVQATEVTWAGPNAIGVRAPAHAAGAVDVVLKTPGFADSALTLAFTYEAPPAPLALGVEPVVGPTAGGITVVVSGKNLSADSQVWFGGVPAQTLVQGPTGLSVLLPPHAAGLVDVVVKSPGVPDSALVGAFTYEAPAKPTLVSIDPTSGPMAGGGLATVKGLELRPESQVWFGTSVAPTKVQGPTGITVVIPASAAGPVDVILKTPGFPDSTLPGAYTYVSPGDPSITLVTPSEGPTEGGVVVAIAGANLTDQSQVTFGGAPAGAVYYGGSSGLGVLLPAHAAGAVDVVVKTPGQPDAVLSGGFTYVQAGPPKLTSVAPATGSTEGGIVVALVGENLRDNSAVYFGGALAAASYYAGEGGLGVLLPPHAAGAVSVVVKTPGFPDTQLAAAFTYIEPGPPTATGIIPAVGSTSGGTSVVIQGTDFRPNCTVWFGQWPASVVFSSPTGIGALSPASTGGTSGSSAVTVKCPGFPDTVAPGVFTYDEPEVVVGGPQIAVAQIQPASGPTTGGNWTLIRGSNLPTGASVRFGATPASDVVVVSNEILTAKVPAGAVGPVSVTVRDPGTGAEATLNAAYTYVDPAALGTAPVLTFVKPALGPAAGGTLSWLGGTGFQAGALVFLDGRPAGSPKVVSDTTATAFTPAGDVGPADVMVVNLNGLFAQLKGGFVYSSGGTKVTLTSVLPSQGSVAGGSPATLTGSGFAPGVLAFIDGVPVSTKLKGTATLEVTTVAHPPGLADLHVTSADGVTAGLDDAYNFILQAPFVAAVSPTYGKPSGGTQVIVSGQGFHPNATLTIGDAAAQVLLASDGLITAIAPPGPLGLADVTVTNPDYLTSTLSDGFEYTDGVPGDVVQVHQVEPPVGPITGGTVVTLHGAGFEPGLAVLFGTGVASDVQFLGPNTLLATAPVGAVGPVDVQVIVPEIGTGSRKAGFFYYDPNDVGPFPVITKISPTVGPTAGGTVARLDVTPAPLTSKVYVDGAAATVLGGDDKSYLVVSMPAHAAGPVPVAVMLTSGKADVASAAFTYYVPAPGGTLPKVNAIAPQDGTSLGGQAVTVSGLAFGKGPLAFIGYRSLAVSAASDTTVAGLTPPHPAGLADIAVTRADGFTAVLKAAFGFTAPGPVPEAVFPTVGHISGGLTVAVSGQGFVAGAKVYVGSVQSPSVTVPAGNVLTFVTPSVATAGIASIVVENPDGKSGTLANAFTLVAGAFEKPPPKVTALTPDHGPFAGGTVLAVYGQNFQPGLTMLFGGKPAKVHLVDPGLVTVTTPSGFIGKVDVTALNPDGQSGSLPGAFTYLSPVDPPPNLLGITPKSGPESGGTAVILTGSKFTGGGVGFVGYRPVSSWTVLNSAIATGTTVPGTPGTKDVVITNGDGQSSTLVGGWDYVGAPHIDSFDPTVGAVVGGKVVLLAGKNFSFQAKVEVGGKLAASTEVLSPLAIRIQTPAGLPGPAQVKVTNPDGQLHVADDPYLYVLPPGITSVFPPVGSDQGGTPIIVSGTHFLEGASVTFGTVPATGVVRVDEDTLVLVAPPGVAGTYVNVTVTNPDGQSAIKYTAFGYVLGSAMPAMPTISALRPATGPTSGGTWGLLDGTGLKVGGRILFGTRPAPTLDVKSTSAARWVSPPSDPGTVAITVVNPDGTWGTMPAAFTFVDDAALDAPPNITALTPNQGPTKGGTPVVFSGTELDAETLVFFDTTAAISVAVEGLDIKATTPAHATGFVSVAVTDSEGQTVILDDVFRFVPPPALTSISPTSGPSAGGTFVTIVGTNFVKASDTTAATRVGFCEDYATLSGCVEVPLTSTTVVSATKITATTPAQVPGTSDLMVSNPDGQFAVLENAFLFRAPPKILGVNPQSGTTLGGEIVTISGSDFQLGAEVSFSGVKATNVQVKDSTTITLTTPPGAAGPAAVVVSNPDLSSHTLGGGFLYVKPPKVLAAFPTLGPETGGTVVTVQGDGYVAGSRVFFGNKEVAAVDIQIESENVLKARTPAGVGPVAIKVQNPDGQSGVLGGGFIYVPVIPAPTISAVTPAFGSTAGGYIVQITGNNFLDGAQVSFGGDAVGWVHGFNAVVKNAGTLIVVTAPAHPDGIVDVRVSNSDGQNGKLIAGFEYHEPLGLPGLAWSGIEPKRGPALGGYYATIYGQGYKQGIKVFFGKNTTAEWVESPEVTRLGPTVLRVKVPAYATNAKVDVRLSNPAVGGVADEVVAPLAFTYGQTVIFEPKGQRLPIDTVHGDRQSLLFDANGDDLDDLFVLHQHRAQELYINTQDVDGIPGKLVDQSVANLPVFGDYFNPYHPRATDIDGDGDLDVVVVYTWSQALSMGLFRNAGDGTFTFEDKADHGLANPYDLVLGDLNCDGRTDALVVGDGVEVIMVGNGLGDFRKVSVLPTHNEPGRGAAIGDVDKDGDNDILIANENAFQNRLYYNNCNNTPMPPSCTFDIPNCVMKTYDGRRYAFCNSEAPNWWDAQTKCEANGFNLATVDSQLEQTFLRQNTTTDTWIGYQEKTTDHNFIWPYGTSSFTKWCSGQPNDSGINDCARITTNADGCWDDSECTNGYRFICEAPVTGTCPAAWAFTDATYGTGKNFPVSGANTRDVLLTDVNGDSWPDAVLVAYGQSTRIYLNNAGNFLNDTGLRFPQTETLTQTIRAFATDVDLDNDPDLILVKHQGNGRHWPALYLSDLEQGGQGAYTDATPSNIPAYRGEDSNDLEVGDLNADGLVDIVVMNENHQDWLFQNHGFKENASMVDANRVPIGSFANNTQLGVPEQTADAYSSALGDIDGDNDLDIVLCFTDAALYPGVWVNDGQGNFFDLSTARMPAGVNCRCEPGEVELQDVDDDGDLDAMFACVNGGMRQLANDGTGHFENTSAINIPSWNSGETAGMSFGDIDGDGDLDWLVGSNSHGNWRTLLNGGQVYGAGKGSYWVARNDLLDTYNSVPNTYNYYTEKAPVVMDLNNDTFLDVFIGYAGSLQNQLWHNTNGTGTMVHKTSSHLPAVVTTTNESIATDVDFDGDVDIFIAVDGTNRLFVGELDYKYADATASNLPTNMSANHTWAEVGDFDLDGFPDFFSTVWGEQNQVLLNKGGAAFDDFTVDLPRDRDPSRSVRAGDLDGDGIVDLFISNRQANRIYLNKTPH